MGAEAMTLAQKRPLRWRWRYLFALAAAVAAALVLRYAVPVPGGPAVKQILVTVPANPLLSPRRVRAAAAAASHGGLLAVDLGAVRAAVETLPWVAHAEVRRVWPNALAIAVTLERPVARWGPRALIDAHGHVFVPGDATRFSALPALTGPHGSGRLLLAAFARAQTLVRAAGLRIRAYQENARGDVRLVFAGGLQVALGREDPLGRLARFVNIAVPALGARLADAATVDMRYPNGFAVGWKGDGDHGKEN